MKSSLDYLCCSLSLLLLFAGCTSTTLIQSTPVKAKVYIDGMFVGETPYTYSDTKIVGSSLMLKLEKEGYKPLVANITKDEEVDVAAVVGGFFFMVPFLWTMKYKPVHMYELKPLTEEVTDGAVNVEGVQKSTADMLRELKQLLDEGVITQGEFDKQKTKILDAN